MSKWVDHESLTFSRGKFSDVPADTKRKLKQMIVAAVSERMKVFNDDHIIFIAYKNSKPIGMVMLSDISPARHFPGESKENTQPYLYNFICSPQHRPLKASVSLMYKVKEYVSTEIKKDLNLDIRENDKHAERFFEKNGFVKTCEWNSPTNVKYNGYTFHI